MIGLLKAQAVHKILLFRFIDQWKLRSELRAKSKKLFAGMIVFMVEVGVQRRRFQVLLGKQNCSVFCLCFINFDKFSLASFYDCYMLCPFFYLNEDLEAETGSNGSSDRGRSVNEESHSCSCHES